MRQPCTRIIFIVSPLWNDRSTQVKRSFHKGEEIVPQRWNGKLLGENLKINT